MKISISQIKIGDRFRRDLGDIGHLVDSIKRHGLLHPVVITDKMSYDDKKILDRLMNSYVSFYQFDIG